MNNHYTAKALASVAVCAVAALAIHTGSPYIGFFCLVIGLSCIW